MNNDHDGDDSLLTQEDRQSIEEEVRSIGAELDQACIAPGWASELSNRRRHLLAELAAGHRLPMDDKLDFYDYVLQPREVHLGGGWKLRLLEDGQEVGGGVFPVEISAAAAETWWAAMPQAERMAWERRTKSGTPSDAYYAHMNDEAWHDATQVAGEWLDSRLQ